MRKPDALRTWLRRCVPALADEAHRLAVYVDEATVHCQPEGLGFEYRYTLVIGLEDFHQPVHALVVPLLAWIAREEPTLLSVDSSAFSLAVDVLGNDLVDIEIRLALTERVRVTEGGDADPGGWTVQVMGPAEPAGLQDLPTLGTLWQIFGNGLPLAWHPDHPPTDPA